MLKNGLLENPKVDAAVMFHVLAGMPPARGHGAGAGRRHHHGKL